jgi:thiamine-phosphate pyrophosphorylase
MKQGYYFITDASLSRAGNFSDVANAVRAGCVAVQYRRKSGSTREMVEEALHLKELCSGIPFLINDRLDVALAVGADGVHIGQDDMPLNLARKILGPGKIVGITVHSVGEAKAAENGGADYVAVSPVFATTTKADAGGPVGVELVRAVKHAVSIPVAAIGGINLENVGSVIAAGADMVCAISCVVTAPDVVAEIEKFNSFFRMSSRTTNEKR